MMPRDLLTVEDVTYGYAGNGWHLEPCSFSVQEGEILGIIGPNGSGKTTLLKLAAGVLTPQVGFVHLKGRPTAEMTPKGMARHVAYLPQQVETFFDYAVEDVVAMGRFPHAKGFGFLTAKDMEAEELGSLNKVEDGTLDIVAGLLSLREQINPNLTSS
jgi:iron complex transport system ATP-binding protein